MNGMQIGRANGKWFVSSFRQVIRMLESQLYKFLPRAIPLGTHDVSHCVRAGRQGTLGSGIPWCRGGGGPGGHVGGRVPRRGEGGDGGVQASVWAGEDGSRVRGRLEGRLAEGEGGRMGGGSAEDGPSASGRNEGGLWRLGGRGAEVVQDLAVDGVDGGGLCAGTSLGWGVGGAVEGAGHSQEHDGSSGSAGRHPERGRALVGGSLFAADAWGRRRGSLPRRVVVGKADLVGHQRLRVEYLRMHSHEVLEIDGRFVIPSKHNHDLHICCGFGGCQNSAGEATAAVCTSLLDSDGCHLNCLVLARYL
mmetsp:Transcript_54143/g.110459  ORF Transcript_54143/g.110459 Transcript_54143/m.110459 type:complete len:306 (+) Transcript_54143:143-1060(+)